MDSIYRKKRLSLVFLGVLLFALIGSFQAMAQPASTYYAKAGGLSFSVLGANPTPSICQSTLTVTQYGFRNGGTDYFSGSLVSCGSGNCVFSGSTSYGISPGSNGTSQTFNYVSRTVSWSGGSCGAPSYGSSGVVSSFTVYSYNDITLSGSVFPSTLCQNASSIALSNYISIAAGAAGIVSYVLDGASTSSTLNPSTLSAGSHTVKASVSWANGFTSVTIGTFTVYSPLSGVGNPSSQSICGSGTAVFSTSGSGSGVTYQWQESSNGGASWGSLSDVGVYSGSATSTLTLTNPGTGRNGYLYRCFVNDAGSCNPTTTAAATLTVYGQIPITTSPTSKSVCMGTTATYSAGATANSGSISYQWQYSSNGGASYATLTDGSSGTGTISGSNSSTLSITPSTTGWNGYFWRCTMQDACGAVNSNTTSGASLTVYGNVGVTGNPSSQTICQGASPSFSCSGSPANGSLSYQWYWVNSGNPINSSTASSWLSSYGTTVTGYNSSTITFSNISTAFNGGSVYCVMNDACGGVSAAQTSSASVTVYTNVSISAQPSTPSAVCPNPASNIVISGLGSAGTSPTYQWQVSTNGGSSWGSTSDGSVYSGSTSSTLSILKTAITNSSMNGYQYRCIVSSGVGCGSAATSSSVTITVNTNVGIATQPTSQTLCSSSGFSPSVIANGTGPYSYQWYSYTGAAPAGGFSATAYSAGAGVSAVSGGTASTLSTGVAGNYFVVVGGTCGYYISNAISLSYYTNVGISAQPASQSICSGSTFNPSVTASGTSPYTYQWYSYTGAAPSSGFSMSAYSPGAGVTAVSGATSSSLNTTTAGNYFVVVGGQCGYNVSNSITLSYYTNVGIATQPTGTTLCPGGTLSTAVSANGTGPYTYQWYTCVAGGNPTPGFSSTAYSPGAGVTAVAGATAANLNTTSAGVYFVVVAGQCGYNISNAVILGYYAAPALTADIASKSYCAGSTITYTVAGTTSPGALQYLWQYRPTAASGWTTLTNIAPYSGTSTNTLTITAAPASMSGYQYQAIISDGTCTNNKTGSTIATITPYANVTTTAPTSIGICPGSSTSFTTTATPHNGAANYTWQVNTGSGFTNITNGGVYSGATTGTLSITAATAAYNNYKYQAVVTDGCGAVTQVTSAQATLTIYTGASITTQPVNSTICTGTNSSFTVGAGASNGALTYQWYVNPNTGTFVAVGNTGVYSGATSATLNLTAPPATYANYQYNVVVKDGCTGLPVTSNTVTLKFYTAIPVTSTPGAQTVCPNAAASFAIAASANTGSLTYQWQVNTGSGFTNLTIASPYSVTGGGATLNLSSAPLSMNGYLYRVILTDGCGASTQYTSPQALLTVNNTVNITTNLNTSTSVCINAAMTAGVVVSGTGTTYQWQENQGTGWNNLSNVGVYSGVTTNTLAISSVSAIYNGYQYRCQITGTCSSATSNVTTVAVIQPPSISTNPTTQTLCAGTGGSFTGSATGTSPTYQWQYSSTAGGTYADISGATSTTYSITSLAATDAGFYQLKSSNGCGFSTSTYAQLTVNPVTTISAQPTDAAVCPTFGQSFTVTSAGTGPFTYQWSFDNNNGTWAPITGANSATLNINNASTGNAGNYRVDVGGACGATITSASAKLTVNPVPSQPTVSDVSRCGDGAINTTATSSSPSPSFNWYQNLGDVTPIYTGPTYSFANLTANTSLFVTAVSIGCESSQKQVNFKHITPANVGLGQDPVSLCAGQGLYNMLKDITTSGLGAGTFSWTANSTNFTGNNFDPSVGAGAYTVTYTPSATDQGTPGCYIPTTRTLNVTTSSGNGGITFTGTSVNNNNTINSCVGDSPINLSSLVNIPNGTWATQSGSGISSSGSNTLFTATSNNYTATAPNAFTYTVVVNGCTGANTLYIYVKNNTSLPVVTGVPASNCPGAALTLSAAVTSVGSYGYQWYSAGASTPFQTGSTLKYTVTKDTTLTVRSLDTSFGCLSPATLVTISTPFKAGVIQVDKSTLQSGDFVKFAFSGGATGNSFAWDFGDGMTSFEQNPVHYYYSLGTFTANLKVNSSIGCSTTLSFSPITVQGQPLNVVTGVEPSNPTIASEKAVLNLYPNPTSEKMIIDSNQDVIAYRILDMTGKEQESKQFDATNNLSIDVSKYVPGMYLVEITTHSSKAVLKMVKQ